MYLIVGEQILFEFGKEKFYIYNAKIFHELEYCVIDIIDRDIARK